RSVSSNKRTWTSGIRGCGVDAACGGKFVTCPSRASYKLAPTFLRRLSWGGSFPRPLCCGAPPRLTLACLCFPKAVVLQVAGPPWPATWDNGVAAGQGGPATSVNVLGRRLEVGT